MLVKTFGCAVFGIHAHTITVEVNIGQGAKFVLVGLPDNAVKESAQRINTALKEIGFKIPRKGVTINMAPADIKKEGAAYDLTLAVGILAADEKIVSDQLDQYIIMGELSLDGSIHPIKGILPMAIRAKEEGFKGLILPEDNAREASMVEGVEVISVKHLSEVIDFLNGVQPASIVTTDLQSLFEHSPERLEYDFSDVKGQENIKRAMEIAAAGGHNLILIGPPGAGKTMLAKRLPTILPPLTMDEALEATKIHSVAGKLGRNGLVSTRPFRSPHHTVSDVALVGGGNHPMPGEISLAHNGVLFLDELPEFKRTVLEVLRQPLEDRVVTISRAKFTVEYPASFMMVASMNPCPCGFYNHPEKRCVCAPPLVQKYLSKISGPLLDRIDLHVEVTPVPMDELMRERVSEKSQDIRERVIKARTIQLERFKNTSIHNNAQMSSKKLSKYCKIDEVSRTLLKTAMERLNLSARAHDRILKVARTIADLESSEHIQATHLAEAIQYRSLDRAGWAG